MNREMRRRYNKKTHQNLTKEEFETRLAVARIMSGNFNMEGLAVPQNFSHVDNYDLAPNGTPVKLNWEGIEKRIHNDKSDLTNSKFVEWVTLHQNDVFHLTREGSRMSLVSFEEDDESVEIDGVITKRPKWLFDLYSDLLIEYDGEWLLAGEIETKISLKEKEKIKDIKGE